MARRRPSQDESTRRLLQRLTSSFTRLIPVKVTLMSRERERERERERGLGWIQQLALFNLMSIIEDHFLKSENIKFLLLTVAVRF